jgi:3-dehydroquinate dehydratase II
MQATDPFSILVISGPNLQLLGEREPEVYGSTTLAQIYDRLRLSSEAHNVSLTTRQSNSEGEIVTWVGEARRDGFHGIVINPGAYTHTSIALLDAVSASSLPCIEVHLSNPDARESFRRRSYIARACLGRVAGFGPMSYELALHGLIQYLRSKSQPSLDKGARKP